MQIAIGAYNLTLPVRVTSFLQCSFFPASSEQAFLSNPFIVGVVITCLPVFESFIIGTTKWPPCQSAQQIKNIYQSHAASTVLLSVSAARRSLALPGTATVRWQSVLQVGRSSTFRLWYLRIETSDYLSIVYTVCLSPTPIQGTNQQQIPEQFQYRKGQSAWVRFQSIRTPLVFRKEASNFPVQIISVL